MGIFKPDIEKLTEKQNVQKLIKALSFKEESIRRKAAEALGLFRDERTVEPLINTLKDEHAGVRGAAAEALGKIGDVRSVQPLAAAIKDLDPSVRWQAVCALGDICDESITEPLISVLNDRDTKVRQTAIEALGEKRDTRAVEPLITVLKYRNPATGGWAAEALGKIGDTRAVEPLISILEDIHIYDPMFRDILNALDSICEMGNIHDTRAIIKPLIRKIKSSTVSPKEGETFNYIFSVRTDTRIKEVFHKIIKKCPAEALLEMLEDDDPFVCEWALRALGERGDVRAVKPIFAAQRDHRLGTTGVPAYALKEIREKCAVEELIDAMKDEDPDVRDWAGTLGKIGDKNAAELIAAGQKDIDLAVSRWASNGADMSRAERAVKVHLAALGDKDKRISRAALNALGETDILEAHEHLFDLQVKMLHAKTEKIIESSYDIRKW